MVPHTLAPWTWVTAACKWIDAPSLTHFQLPPQAFNHQPIKKFSLHSACPGFNTRKLYLRAIPRPGVCHLTRRDTSPQPLRAWEPGMFLTQRLCSRTLAALRGWKHQDFWIGVLSHSFLIKMLLHHGKFLTVPNDFNPVIEPLVKNEKLRAETLASTKAISFRAIHGHMLSKCCPWEAGHFIRQKHK